MGDYSRSRWVYKIYKYYQRCKESLILEEMDTELIDNINEMGNEK